MRLHILRALAAVLGGGCAALLQGLLFAPPLAAQGGGLDARGCHNDRKAGTYHCHAGPLAERSFASASDANPALNKRATSPAPSPTSTPSLLAGEAPSPTPAQSPSATANPLCGLGRAQFERMVALRMQNYESAGDSWSDRARQWRAEITANINAGRATASLDAVYGRYTRYCTENDSFMAGITVGEWVGLSLRAPTAPPAASESATTTVRPRPTADPTVVPSGFQVRVEPDGNGWRVRSASPGVWTQCRVAVGASSANIGELTPQSSTLVTRENFVPPLGSVAGATMFVTCTAGGKTFTASAGL